MRLISKERDREIGMFKNETTSSFVHRRDRRKQKISAIPVAKRAEGSWTRTLSSRRNPVNLMKSGERMRNDVAAETLEHQFIQLRRSRQCTTPRLDSNPVGTSVNRDSEATTLLKSNPSRTSLCLGSSSILYSTANVERIGFQTSAHRFASFSNFLEPRHHSLRVKTDRCSVSQLQLEKSHAQWTFPGRTRPAKINFQ